MYGQRKVDPVRVLQLRRQGVLPTVIAERLGVSLAAVSRALSDHDAAVKAATPERRTSRNGKTVLHASTSSILPAFSAKKSSSEC